MKNLKKIKILYTGILLMAGIALLHSFFIFSDPDTNADPSTRGAFTDEALYSLQSRNYVVSNEFSLTENITWIQGPVYGAIQIAVYKVFGVKLSVARIITIAAVLLILFLSLLIKQSRKVIICFILFGYTEFHVFSFSHYAMSYMISLSLVVLAIVYFVNAITSEQKAAITKYTLLCVLTLFLAFVVKVNFFYAFFFPLLSSLLLYLFEKEKEKELKKKKLRVLILFLVAFTVAMLLYFVCWYLPNKPFYDFVVFGNVEAMIPGTFSEIIQNVKSNFHNLIWGTHLRYVFLLLVASAFVAIYLLYKRKFSTFQKTLLIVSMVWFLIEMHRFAMWYLPFRYILGIILSGFLFMIVTAFGIWENGKKIRYVLIIPVLMILYVNGKDYTASYLSRTTAIYDANKYFSSIPFHHKKIIGTWAACMNWESDAFVLPVWDKYLYYRDPIRSYSPVAVVAESGENDSNQAFLKRGILLNEISDSVKVFKIGTFQVNVFWLKKTD
jgi:hypothetical protein